MLNVYGIQFTVESLDYTEIPPKISMKTYDRDLPLK